MFCQETCDIKRHSDKMQLFQKLTLVFAAIQNEAKTISDLLLSSVETSLVDKAYAENLFADTDN